LLVNVEEDIGACDCEVTAAAVASSVAVEDVGMDVGIDTYIVVVGVGFC